MINFRKAMVLMGIFAVATIMPIQAQEIDLTRFFAESTAHLADEARVTAREERAANAEGHAFADVKPLEQGDKLMFTTFNVKRNAHERIRAELKKIGQNCYVFVQEGKTVNPNAINKIVSEFDNKIYPETRSMFGSEWSPGIDGDKRIYLLLLDIVDGYNPQAGQKSFVAGYFNAADCYTKSKQPQSNEKEMLYLDIYPSQPGSEKFLSTVAHEFQHMIHWNHDPKEFTWVNESLSQLAPYLCGYGHPSQVNSFMQNPDNNLVAWEDSTMIANYGQVYLWAQYISTKIASTDPRRREFIRKMVAQKSQGFSGLNLAIKKQNIKNTAKNVFRAFCVANYLNDNRINGGIYGYEKDLSAFYLKPELSITTSPYRIAGSVKCWSAKGIQVNVSELRGKSVLVKFDGQTIRAGEYENQLDVALIHYSANKKELPQVQWLRIQKNKIEQRVNIPANNDRMIALVINRGPEQMKAEQSYAKNVMPAKFTIGFGESKATQANVTTRARPSIQNQEQQISPNIINEISASIQQMNAAEAGLTTAKDENSTSAAEIAYDLSTQKLSIMEKKFLAALKISLQTEKGSFVLDFVLNLAENPESGQGAFANLVTSIKAVLQFEQSQGNQKAGELLDKFQKGSAENNIKKF
jgi:hypothetical protein